MANKRPRPEEIVSKLRQVEVLMGQDMSRFDAIRQVGVVEQTYYRWRKKYRGMGGDQLKELKRLQKENERLRRACRVLGQHLSIQPRVPQGRTGEYRLVADMIALTRQYGRYGYRRITALLRGAGWSVSDGRIERLWRREGLRPANHANSRQR